MRAVSKPIDVLKLYKTSHIFIFPSQSKFAYNIDHRPKKLKTKYIATDSRMAGDWSGAEPNWQ